MPNRFHFFLGSGNLKILLILLSSHIASPAWAADPADSPANALRSLFTLWNVIVIILCIVRRKKEIGGWLLYYYFQLYSGAVICLIIALLSLKNFLPMAWGGFVGLYLLYLVSTVPNILVIFVELYFAERLRKSRSFGHLHRLRIVLWFHTGFAVLGLLIDLVAFQENVPLAVIGLISPAIWLPYFYCSKRVNRVFHAHDSISAKLQVAQA